MNLVQIPPTMKIVSEKDIERYLDRVALVWLRMEREGIKRLAEQGKPDAPRNR